MSTFLYYVFGISYIILVIAYIRSTYRVNELLDKNRKLTNSISFNNRAKSVLKQNIKN